MSTDKNILTTMQDAILKTSNDLITMINRHDHNLSIVYINDKFAELLGFAKNYDFTDMNYYQRIFEDDRNNVVLKISNLELNEEFCLEYRLKNENDDIIWVLQMGQLTLYKNQALIISKVININEFRTNYDEIFLKAQNDPLTKIYNRDFFRIAVLNYLNNNRTHCALAMIDIDNFKYVNDNLGHRFGDEILIMISQAIIETASGHFYGRLGGDEFVVFFRNLASEAEALKAGELLRSAINKCFKEKQVDSQLSVSIGLVFEKHCQVFDNMLNRADIALNNAKARGKNQVVLYDSSLSLNKLENERSTNVSPILYTMMGNQASDILQIMANSSSNEQSIVDVVDYLGKHYPLDRISIVEKSLDLKRASIIYVWDRNKKSVNIDTEYIEKPIEEWIFPKFNSQDFAYIDNTYDLAEPMRSNLINLQVLSYLNVQIREGSEIIGYIFFDISNENVKLNDIEVHTLVYNAKIMSEIFRHRRNLQMVEERGREVFKLYNEITEQGVVVLNQKSKEIIFTNFQLRKYYPDVEKLKDYNDLMLGKDPAVVAAFEAFLLDKHENEFVVEHLKIQKIHSSEIIHDVIILIYIL